MSEKQKLEGWEVRLNDLHAAVFDPDHGVVAKVNKMYHAIFGVNGSDGLIRKMKKVEEAVDVIESAFGSWCDVQKDIEIETLKDKNDKIEGLKRERFRNRIMVGSLIVATVSTIAAVASRFIP